VGGDAQAPRVGRPWRPALQAGENTLTKRRGRGKLNPAPQMPRCLGSLLRSNYRVAGGGGGGGGIEGASPHGEHGLEPQGLHELQESQGESSQHPQPVIARPAKTRRAARTRNDLFIVVSEKRNLRWSGCTPKVDPDPPSPSTGNPGFFRPPGGPSSRAGGRLPRLQQVRWRIPPPEGPREAALQCGTVGRHLLSAVAREAAAPRSWAAVTSAGIGLKPGRDHHER
jgi:hypothetical protein